MKKKLEADLMSIAHRVLQMKNKSDINQLCIETRKLYEKLSILQFVEEHFEGAKPTIGQAEIVEKMKQFFDENQFSEVPSKKNQEEVLVAQVEVEQEVLQEIIVPVVIEKAEDRVAIEEEKTINDSVKATVFLEQKISEVALATSFELEDPEEDQEEKILVRPEEVQISFLDLLGSDYSKTTFVKVEDNEAKSNPLDFDLPKETIIQNERKELLAEMEVSSKDIEHKAVSVNEKFAQGISIGLNDRIGFLKNLFGNSEEDYNRVLNQLITYDNFAEARSFIEDMVKPDYNDWQGKEEYEQRFLEIIEKKFA